MSIQNYLNQIKNAVFGRDVRQSIYDAIKQCYDDASINHDNANMEVKLARGEHDTLNERFNSAEEKIQNNSAQLEQKAQQSYVEATNKRIDGLIIESGDSNVEVINARTSITKNKTFSLMNDRFEEIEKTINLKVENLVVNGGFNLEPGSKWWTILGTMVSDINNELVFISSTKNGRIQRPIVFDEDDLIYRCAMIKTTSNKVGIGAASRLLNNHSGSGLYEFVSSVSNINSKYTSIVDTRDESWDNISVKEVCSINLTSVFGKGFEPSKEEMDFMFSKRGWFDGVIYDFINYNSYYNILKILEKSINNEIENSKYETSYVNNELSNIKAIAHRGYNLEAPENTLPAYTLAKRKGFKYVECDIQYTLDKVPILLHNATIDNTSNGTGLVAEKTFEELRKLDFGLYKGEQYRGTKIPTFEEFLIHCKKLDLHPYLDVKIGGTPEVTELMSIVKRLGMQRNVTWVSSLQKIAIVLRLDPKARVGWGTKNITDEGIAGLTALATNDNYVFADLEYTTITKDIAKKILDGGAFLECYTVDDESAIDNLVALGITGMTTNHINITEYYNKNL